MEKLANFFKMGNSKNWMNNVLNRLYRNTLNFKELKQLVRFYNKPSGQEMPVELPLIMLQLLVAA